jgi:hypothetical protein
LESTAEDHKRHREELEFLPLAREIGYMNSFRSIYQFKDELTNTFFRFAKKLVREKSWANLPSASKAIYPVIGVHCDAEGWAFPGQQTIAILSGRRPKTVRQGIKGLEALPGFWAKPDVTSTGQRSYRYHIQPPPQEPGASFFFHKEIITGGNWLHLTPSAQALYPTLRTFAFFDSYAYDGSLGGDFWESYVGRQFDFVNMDFEIMAEYAGISSRSLDSALQSLLDHNLLAEVEDHPDSDPAFDSQFPTWAVYVEPEYRYKTDYLNQRVTKRYGNPCKKVRKILPPKKIDKKIVSRNIRRHLLGSSHLSV